MADVPARDQKESLHPDLPNLANRELDRARRKRGFFRAIWDEAEHSVLAQIV